MNHFDKTFIEIPISYNASLADALDGQIILIKYGGNAIQNEKAKRGVINDIIALKKMGAIPVLVHGGGRAIKKLLAEVGVESEFVDGHRKTDARAMRYVEMALSGGVNSELVRLINEMGHPAVGISGNDGGLVTARKRQHRQIIDEQSQPIDLGFVGDVEEINTQIIHTLMEADYIPVISPVSTGTDYQSYNINADMFAGHLAGALQASHYLALTNVAGLLENIDEPSTLIPELTFKEAQAAIGEGIHGGMIPKVESCILAIKQGAGAAHIINGLTPHNLLRSLITEEKTGTLIHP